MPQGIRDISPEAGDWLRARVARDRDFYFRIRERLLCPRRGSEAIVWLGRVWNALYTLDSAAHCAGTVKPIDPANASEPDNGRWIGEGI